MAQHTIEFRLTINAAPEKVFDFFADHESFGRIWPGKTRRIRESSEPGHPNGVGSVREIRVGPTRFEETQTVYDRPNRIEYTVTRGSPIKNHLGQIQLSKNTDGGTDIDYRITFEPKIPLTGKLIARSLENGWAKGIKPIIDELEQGA